MNILDQLIEENNKLFYIKEPLNIVVINYYLYECEFNSDKFTIHIRFQDDLKKDYNRQKIDNYPYIVNTIMRFIKLSILLFNDSNKCFDFYLLKIKEYYNNSGSVDIDSQLFFCIELLLSIIKIKKIFQSQNILLYITHESKTEKFVYLINENSIMENTNNKRIHNCLIDKCLDILSYIEELLLYTYNEKTNEIKFYNVINKKSDFIKMILFYKDKLDFELENENIFSKLFFYILNMKEIRQYIPTFFKTNQINNINKLTDLHNEIEKLLYNINVYNFSKNNNQLDTYILNQYTSENTLKSMLNLKDTDNQYINNNIKMRMYNSLYMNDPKEGKLLFSHKDFNFLSRYEKIKDDFSYNSRTYLSSFIYENKNLLNNIPMWNYYGDNCRGLSLGFNIKCIPNACFVIYIDKNGNIINSIFNQQLKKQLKKQLEIIANITQNLLYQELDSFLLNNILYEMDRIRFYIKDASYSYENECRILKHHPIKSQLKHDSNNPKLFIDTFLPIEQICFGNLFPDKNIWKVYINEYLPNVKVQYSKLAFNG